MKLGYSIALVTRNRLDALEVSIPSFLSQSILANRLVVVDSSDDHKNAVEVLRRLTRSCPFEVVIVEGGVGTTIQRNIALKYIETEIVFFPDDDSVWYERMAEEVLSVYESDTGEVIVGVCGIETVHPPAVAIEGMNRVYRKDVLERIKPVFIPWRNRLEALVCPDPFKVLASMMKRRLLEKAGGAFPLNARCVEFMTGFRMSFRTRAIRAFGFDELLKGYGHYEDVDASLSVWMLGYVVAATSAKVYHHKHPASRGKEFSMGFSSLVNRAYVVSKFSQPGDKVRRLCLRYSIYKSLLYLLSGVWRRGAFLKFQGARKSLKLVHRILATDSTNLKIIYVDAVRSLEGLSDPGMNKNNCSVTIS